MAPPSPAFLRLGPIEAATPLLIAVPHAGRHYPRDLLSDSAVPHALLEQLEDAHADRLIGPLVTGGAVAIVAQVARAWIDLNRAPNEIDPAMGGQQPPSVRVRSGLGLIPRRLGQRDLWTRLPDARIVEDRLRGAHIPYHEAIRTALRAAWRRHGVAVLIDCHSMPPLRGNSDARIVLGDRHGRSAGRHVTAAALESAKRSGLQASLNSPYAGAYTLDRHGCPAEEVHALQVEVDRSLYLDGTLRHPIPAAERIAQIVAEIGWAAVDAAQRSRAIAAE